MGRRTEMFVREIGLSDRVGYLRISRLEDIGDYVSFMAADSLQEATERIEHYQRMHNTKLYGLFSKSNRLIGVMDAVHYPGDNYATVSYFIGKRYRGNGYAELAIKILFDTLDVDELHFEVHELNSASHRVQQKLHSRVLNYNKYCTYVYPGF